MVLIAITDYKEGSIEYVQICRLPRAFATRIHKDVMERMAQTRDLEANPLREHEQLKDASAYIYQNLMSWSNLHLSIYKLQ